jgi:hypothetical protein
MTPSQRPDSLYGRYDASKARNATAPLATYKGRESNQRTIAQHPSARNKEASFTSYNSDRPLNRKLTELVVASVL